LEVSNMPIKPPTASLTDLQPLQFELDPKVPATWSINPSHGTIDVNNGLYIAPGQVTTAEDIVVTATPQGGGPTSVAVVRLQPRVAIIPASVSLKAGESQHFEATDLGDPAKAVTWVISPGVGEMQAGSYMAPSTVKDPAVVTITAKSAVDQTKVASASVHLVPGQPSWAWVLTVGVYLTGLFLLAWPLVISWPPPPADRTAFDQSTAANTAAESLAKTKELVAQVALETAQKSAEGAKNAPEGSALRTQAARDQSASEQAAKEKAEAQEDRLDKLAAQRVEAEKFAAQEDRVKTLFGPVSRDVDLLLLVLLAGALGAWIHVGRSYVDFVGNRTFRVTWIPWYLLHPLLGSGLALIFYLSVRGGFFITGTKGSDVNPYGITAVAALVGLFSKQATNKLAEVFDTLFRSDKGKDLKDKLDPQAKTS
jgi:hypothetical protein